MYDPTLVEPTVVHNDLAIRKLRLAVERGYFRTIDLFAGCGGMTLGFHRANFKCISAIEKDEYARGSHIRNFAPLAPKEGYAAYTDVTEISPKKSIAHVSPLFPDTEMSVDIILGGPPCQPFSRLGRAALWRIAGKDHAHAEDTRATMYHYYLEYVAELQPIAFVMENVREMGKFAGKNVAEEIAVTAEALGYEVRYTLLNAVWYGVPQLRERMFIIGIRRELNVIPTFPKITHNYELPVGYSTSRAGTGKIEVLPPFDHYVDHAARQSRLKPAVTAQQAFADLPPITHHLDGKKGKGVPRITDGIYEYNENNTEFSLEMKRWPHFTTNAPTFTGHVIRYTPRDYEIFRRMPPGAMYPEALLIAKQIFAEKLSKIEQEEGIQVEEGSSRWQQLLKETVPPYKDNRYPNKFRKMFADHPARTVPAHIGKDSYSHIHYDDNQARAISLREAARLQSFPDKFALEGSMNEQLRQIGNAVPPLLAYAVAKHLSSQLRTATNP
jgi:DNA (cytosine-5)-methyltransferase 1